MEKTPRLEKLSDLRPHWSSAHSTAGFFFLYCILFGGGNLQYCTHLYCSYNIQLHFLVVITLGGNTSVMQYSNIQYSTVNVRGEPKRGLASQGKIWGTVDLIGSQKVSMDDLTENVEKHQIVDLSVITYKKIFAWELDNAKRFAEPIRHLPKKSCQVWMSVDYPELAEKVQALMKKASKLEKEDELQKVAKEAGISTLKRAKGSMWRVLHKELDIAQKFPYSLEKPESPQRCASRGICLPAQHSSAPR